MFQNREEAGVLLADKLREFKRNPAAIVLAIPRGGVVVGRQIATRLSLPLSIIVIKKLGAPHNPELAIGAVAEDVQYIDWDIALRSGVEQEYLDKELEEKKKEVEERINKLKIPNPKSQIRNKKTIILTDDGVATGATTLAAIKYIKSLKLKTQNLPARNAPATTSKMLAGAGGQLTTILAVPVIAKETYDKLKSEVDKIVALEISQSFSAVGQFYREFPQVTDEEVLNILQSPK